MDIKDATPQQMLAYMLHVRAIRVEAEQILASIPSLLEWIDYRMPAPGKEFERRLERFKNARST